MSRVLELNMVPIYRPASGMLLAGQEMQAPICGPVGAVQSSLRKGLAQVTRFNVFGKRQRSAMLHATLRMQS
jgi:hypothetical protein